MTWNEDRERLIAAAELGDATPQIAADLLVAARKRAFDAEAAHAWINASERLPENGAKVLAIVREVIILVYDTDTEFPGAPWRTENADIVFNKSSIVKWMPLPEPPK